MGMAPLVHFLEFISLLSYVSHHHASLPCHVSFAAACEFGWARVVLAVRHRPHEDVEGLKWCMGMAPLVHFLNFISLLVHVSPPRASLPCHVSFTAGGEFGWARVVLAVRHRPHEDVMGLEWCTGMPRLVHFLDFISLLIYVSPPCASVPYHASSQSVSSVGQGLCWLCMHRPHEDVAGLEWCMGMPPLVHFLEFISLLVNVSPPCASLPCHAYFAAAGEFGWARVVLAARAPAARGRCGFGVVHGNGPPCALPRLYFSSRSRLPTTRFPPLSCLLRRSW